MQKERDKRVEKLRGVSSTEGEEAEGNRNGRRESSGRKYGRSNGN